MKIKQHFEYGLQGQFKVDVYDRQGELVETTDFFDNFITQTGLNYPLTYNFADCFRYLTLGRQGGANNMSVTGLLDPGHQVIALVKNYDTEAISYQTWDYLGDSELDKKSNSSAGSCGTIVGADGPSWYRGWKLPTGDNVFTEGQTTISEFMVSPSTGLDETGRYAFSRIPRSVSIPSGTRTIVTYMLNVKIKHTGVNYFHSGTFNTGQAEISEQRNLVESFDRLSGYYRQVYHGLRCVDNQGRTFIPKYGDPMEPSNVRLDDLAIYFSPDNSQFDVNRHGGGQTNINAAYASDGLCALSFNHDLAANANVSDDEIHNNAKMAFSSLPSDSSSPFEHHQNIRLKASSSERPPRLGNWTTATDQTIDLEETVYNYTEMGTQGASAVSMATFGRQAFKSEEFDRGYKAAFSSMMSNLGVNLLDFTGRRRNIVRKAFITPINALGHNSRFGSLVYAMKNGSAYWPAVDCMFFDDSGRSVMQHYRVFSGCHLTERGRGIIKSRFTTDPPTYGGYDVETIHGPIVYDTNLGVSDITGHTGFYLTSSFMNNETWMEEEVKATAVRMSGAITPTYTAPGDTGNYAPTHVDAGTVTIGGVRYYGWGAVQGHLVANGYDYGIVDHSVEVKDKVLAGHPNFDSSDPDAFQVVRAAVDTPPIIAGTDGDGYDFSKDDLKWPNMEGGKLNFVIKDLHYYDVGLGVIADPESYFTATNQVVADVTFNPTQGISPAEDMMSWDLIANTPNYYPLTSITQNSSATSAVAGFILSRNTGWLEVDRNQSTNSNFHGQFDTSATYSKGDIVDDNGGATVAAGANIYRSVTDNNTEDTLTNTTYWEQLSTIPYDGRQLNMAISSTTATVAAGIFSDNIENLNDQPVTGWLVPSSHIANGDILNTTWVANEASFPPANSVQVAVENAWPSSIDPYIGPTIASFQVKAGAVSQIFDGFGDFEGKATNMVARKSGQNLGPNDGPAMTLVFTGHDKTAGAGKNANPIYVIAGSAKDSAGDFDWYINSQYTGSIRMTDFLKPQGYFLHYESTRLLPNFATGQSTGGDAYARNDITWGGAYPGMSNLNTLEVYMDVSWSAPCAGVVGCVEQEA